jgi:hypothetical protein
MTNTIKTKDIAALMTRVQKLPEKIDAIEAQIHGVQERMQALKKAGLIYASGHWRAQKYFTLIYPQKDGVRPSPTYIGTDETKIQEALQGIERAKEYDRLKKIALEQASILSEASLSLSELESILTIR